MAVTVTDNRTTLDAADAVTNFNQGTLNTTDFAEATGSVALANNIGTQRLVFTGTIPNFLTAGNELIYIWSANNATQNAFDGGGTGANASHAMLLNDGTNDVLCFMAGNNLDQFKHAEGQVSFQCMLFDADHLSEADSASRLHALSGTAGSVDMTTLTEIGMYYVTLSKALGGGFNNFIDIIRYGGRDDGIQIAGGTTGDRGTFLEVAIEDRSTADVKAHGIIREYTANTFGVQGTLRIGDSGTGTSYFEVVNQVVVWEGRLVDDDKFALFGDSNGTGTNVIRMTGVSFSSAGPGVLVDFSTADKDELLLDRCSFVDLLNAISYPTDTNGTTLDHDVINCLFNNCGQVDPGGVFFSGNTITDSTASATGSVLLDGDDSIDWHDLTFNSGGSGHAIYITATGTYTFDSFIFNDFGASDTTDAAVYNDSGGAVTIDVAGGVASPTVRNGAGASTTVNNNVTIGINGVTEGSQCSIIATVGGPESEGTVLMNEPATSAGVATELYNLGSDQPAIFKARSSGIISAAIADDGGVLVDETENSRDRTGVDSVTLFPTTPVVNVDQYYFGGLTKFSRMKVLVNTAGVGTYVLTWEYWNGAWTTLTVTSTDDFKTAAPDFIEFTAPGDWVVSTENSQGPFFYIRVRWTSGTMTTSPKADNISMNVTKYKPYSQVVTIDGDKTVTAIWQVDTNTDI